MDLALADAGSVGIRAGEGRLGTLDECHGYRAGDGAPGPAVLRGAGLLG
ncbi:MAG: hypothetical protein ACKO2C_04105 [Actinomycetes bacterium]